MLQCKRNRISFFLIASGLKLHILYIVKSNKGKKLNKTSRNLSMKLVWTWTLWSHTPEDNFPLKLFFSWLPFNCFQNLHIFWSIDYLKWRCHTFLILRKKVFLIAIWSSGFLASLLNEEAFIVEGYSLVFTNRKFIFMLMRLVEE